MKIIKKEEDENNIIDNPSSTHIILSKEEIYAVFIGM